MFTIYRHEMNTSLKNLAIWSICVGGMGLFCILLFSSMKDSIGGMAEGFASMGAFSDAFGMSQLSIATLSGFYAAEVGTIHALGGAMFAAIISTTMLSKEEDGHTGEFLYSMPVSRVCVITAKWLAVAGQILLFNVLCVSCYLLGILILGEQMPLGKFFLYHVMQFFLHLEVAAICYAVSAFLRKNRFGIGLGIVLMLYAYDLIARIIPDLSSYKIISPFSFANAADILSSGETDIPAAVTGIIVLVVSLGTAYTIYNRRDLAV